MAAMRARFSKSMRTRGSMLFSGWPLVAVDWAI
jgi:hypothetical protein